MRAIDWLLALLVLVLAVGFSIGTYYLALQIAEGIAKILSIVVAAAPPLLMAIFKFSLDKQKELDILTENAKRERYFALIDRIAPFVRSNGQDTDAFTVAFLAACVHGSKDVIAAIEMYRNKPTDSEAIQKILKEMRKDVGLVATDLDGVNFQRAFPPQGYTQ